MTLTSGPEACPSSAFLLFICCKYLFRHIEGQILTHDSQAHQPNLCSRCAHLRSVGKFRNLISYSGGTGSLANVQSMPSLACERILNEGNRKTSSSCLPDLGFPSFPPGPEKKAYEVDVSSTVAAALAIWMSLLSLLPTTSCCFCASFLCAPGRPEASMGRVVCADPSTDASRPANPWAKAMCIQGLFSSAKSGPSM